MSKFKSLVENILAEFEGNNFLTDKQEILAWLKEYDNRFEPNKYNIDDNGVVNVDGDVILLHRINKEFNRIKVKFGKVTGDFYATYNKLISLKGAPDYVGGSFDCHYNALSSLEYSPKYVGGDFDCRTNKLKSLKGTPNYIGGDFICAFNKDLPVDAKPDENCIIKGKVYNQKFYDAHINPYDQLNRAVEYY